MEGIEGLNARSSLDVPMVKYHPAMELVPVPLDGMHRLGIQARGLTPKVIFQVGVWIKGGPNTKIALNVFDGYYVTTGTSSFDLTNGTVLSSVGAVRKAGVKAGSDYWYKAWLRMLSTNGWLVTYIQVLNGDGAATYKGDGKKVVRIRRNRNYADGRGIVDKIESCRAVAATEQSSFTASGSQMPHRPTWSLALGRD